MSNRPRHEGDSATPFRFRSRTALFPLLLLGTALLPLACSGEPDLVFTDWILPVAEGTPVKEYAQAPPASGDDDAIQMVEDLAIGSDASDPDALLYRPVDVVATADGTMFVADRGANAIKEFAPDGTFRRTLGGPGQGPGEFTGLSQLVIAGDMLVAYDARNFRFSVWTLDGEHLADHKPLALRTLAELRGLSDGTLLATYGEVDADGNWRQVLVHTTLAGQELDVLEDRPGAWFHELGAEDPADMLQTMLGWLEEPRFLVAVGVDDTAYVALGSQYQVLAMSSNGTPRWAMRRAGPPPTIPERDKRAVIEGFLRREPFAEMFGDADIAVDEIHWPRAIPAIFELRTDGRGRLLVFLPPKGLQMSRPDSWPVHVYSAAGEYIAGGVVTTPWDHARGDYVYEVRGALTEEPSVIRYRLTVNGQ